MYITYYLHMKTVPVYMKGPTDDVSSYIDSAYFCLLGDTWHIYTHNPLTFKAVSKVLGILSSVSPFITCSVWIYQKPIYCFGRAFPSSVNPSIILRKKHTFLLCCDISRACDCISHKNMIGKLESYGITGDSLMVVKSYLNLKQQGMSWHVKNSSSSFVNHGVPQGSILGPFRFVVAIKIVLKRINKCYFLC